MATPSHTHPIRGPLHAQTPGAHRPPQIANLPSGVDRMDLLIPRIDCTNRSTHSAPTRVAPLPRAQASTGRAIATLPSQHNLYFSFVSCSACELTSRRYTRSALPPTAIYHPRRMKPERSRTFRIQADAERALGKLPVHERPDRYQAILRRRRRWIPLNDWGVLPRLRPIVGA